ncbi:hypothetical protein [Brevundimonas kwangchunensis]|uniref:hypothetical protein n=1 Tax=Brevundimonas kwangchunensis TaxID=322163 RepID=UPI0031CDF611
MKRHFAWVRRVPPWTIAAGTGAVVIVAAGLMVVQRVPLPGVDPIDPESAMQISLVEPVEPVVEPGGRMEVGDLSDGFRPEAIPVAVVENDETYREDFSDAWVEPDYEPAPRSSRWRDRREDDGPRSYEQRAESEPRDAPRNPYGFDGPRRDFEAERAARRERIERMQAEGWREVPSGARLSADSAFY